MQQYGLVRDAGRFGVHTGRVSLDWAEVIERKDRLLRELQGEKQSSLEGHGIHLLPGNATFLSSRELLVGGQTVQAGKVIVATGSHAARPRVPGTEMAITSDDALEMRELPESVAIIGGGVIAMEFAHIWNAAGVRVTVLEMGARILSSMDPDVVRELTRICVDRGIEIVTRAQLEKLSREGNRLVVRAMTPEGMRDFKASTVMLATGRVPNVEGINLEAAGVQVRRGRITTDEYLQTTTPNVYAAGDAIGGYCLAPVAAHEGRVAARNAVRGDREKVDYSLVATTVFTLPPVAAVGLSEAQARATGAEVKIAQMPYAGIERAAIEGETDGLAKILVDGQTGRLLGAHLVGADADELIHQVAIAMKGHLTWQEMLEVIHAHPTFSEVIFGALRTLQTGHPDGCCG